MLKNMREFNMINDVFQFTKKVRFENNMVRNTTTDTPSTRYKNLM